MCAGAIGNAMCAPKVYVMNQPAVEQAARREPAPGDPGYPYANMATHLAAITLGSDGRVQEFLCTKIQAGRRPDIQRLRMLLEPKLASYGVSTRRSEGPIDWSEVRDELYSPDVNWDGEVAGDVATRAAPATPALVTAGRQRQEPIPQRSIEADVLQVLQDCAVNGRAVALPARQLERKLYEAVNKVLHASGFKWSTSARAFMLDASLACDAQELLEGMLATGQYQDPADVGFFATQPAEVDALIEHAALAPGMSVLEPSAGHGALALAAAKIVGLDNVWTYELLPRNCNVLRAAGLQVTQADFLAMEPTWSFDRVIANPPFGNQADIEHIRHAAKFLKADGELVSIMSPTFEFRANQRSQQFRDLLEAAGEVVQRVDAGAFRKSGTDVATVMIKLRAADLPREFWAPDDERHAAAAQHMRQRA